MSETPLPEVLENFLQQPPSLPAPARLQAVLLRQTSTRLRKRRRWPVAVSVAAAIMLALASAYFGLRSRDIEPLPGPRPEIVQQPVDPMPEPVVAAVPMSPVELENVAFDAEDDQQRVRLYFRAGDLYFEQHQDIESALRCYHQALHYGDARELDFNPDDNFLAMALKRDRRKEQ
jgi:hypothetical protein